MFRQLPWSVATRSLVPLMATIFKLCDGHFMWGGVSSWRSPVESVSCQNSEGSWRVLVGQAGCSPECFWDKGLERKEFSEALSIDYWLAPGRFWQTVRWLRWWISELCTVLWRWGPVHFNQWSHQAVKSEIFEDLFCRSLMEEVESIHNCCWGRHGR